MPNKALSKAEAVDLFDYDPETGSLAWKISPSRAVKIGAIAGTKNTSGHLQVVIKGRAFSAHRIIWLLTHGEWPIGQIDHINRIPSDNRLVNLRIANGTENSRNRNKHKNNKSGAKGVHPKGKKYQA